jgi:carboxypeptidase C (cathepsin A)
LPRFVESQRDPENDPVILWTNGGPGCSGLVGFGTEHGPYIISREGVLRENPFSWNKVASILYIEQPAGVGFSYHDLPEEKYTGDAQAAFDNYNLILEFLERFPERKSNDFYVSSESYGGHYIPQLALEILRQDTQNKINFKGWLLGNPYVDPYSNTITQYRAFYSHGLLAKPLYDQWQTKCTDREYIKSKECDDIANEMFKELGDGINPYALDYPVCEEKASSHLHGKTSPSQVETLLNKTQGMSSPFLPKHDNYKPCSLAHIEKYLNHPKVRLALHVNEEKAVDIWTFCAPELRYNFTDIVTPTVSAYKELVDQAIAGKHSLNMLVYSGDDDSVCSTAGTQEWIWDLTNATTVWKQWHVDKQTAGFVTHFDLGDNSHAKFTFATVHGAGHEVPAYRPLEALTLLEKYLSGEW